MKLTALGLRKLPMDDTNCSGVTVTVFGWRWLALQKISHAVRKISHTVRKCFFLEYDVENIKKLVQSQFFGPLPCPSICFSVILLREKSFFWLFLKAKLCIFKKLILTPYEWRWKLWGDANWLGLTLTAKGWRWLFKGDAYWQCKKFRMLCEKFRIQCENASFLSKTLKTSKTS